MIDVIKPRDGCLYEIRQKGQRDPCYVVVPDTTVRLYIDFHTIVIQAIESTLLNQRTFTFMDIASASYL